MTDLARQQCFHHAGREASVRCPSCRRDYCRECVTEHEDRYLCSTCLRAHATNERRPPRRVRLPVGPLLGLAGLLTAWTVFYAATQYLALQHEVTRTNRVLHAR